MNLLMGLVAFIGWMWVALEIADYAHRLYKRLTRKG